MESEEQKIEARLKQRLGGIVPPRASFSKVKEAVTNETLHRSIVERGHIPSPYQSVVSFIMNKVILIGIPVAAVAVIAVLLVMKPTVSTIENTKVAVAPAEGQPAPEKVAPTAPVAVNTAPAAGNVDTSSIDSISAGFLTDANLDASAVINDTSDQMAVNSELATYDTVKSTSYEIAI
jgi:hypothetical protein